MNDMTLGQGMSMDKTLPHLREELSVVRFKQEQSRNSLYHRRADMLAAQGAIESLQRQIEDLTAQIEVLEQAERITDEP